MNNLKSSCMVKEQPFGYIILLVISLVTLFFGIFGIIENKTPQDLASISTLGISFITHIEYNLMIFLGALGITTTAMLSQYNKKW